MRKKILVAMSGGVDSSVAALLLKNQGHDVAGITMRLSQAMVADEKAAGMHCAASRAVEDARKVCGHLAIPHFTIDFSGQLQRLVIEPFLAEYRRGRTPNPCVRCNRTVKFGALLDYATDLGYGLLATGHYVATERLNGKTVLRRGSDPRKDQSYFLYAVRGEVLDRLVFPLAGYTKQEVRNIARAAGLPVAEKPESQDICFIPDGDYRKFFSSRLETVEPGDIVDTTGVVRGRHRGIPFYTIGQRSGLGIAAPAPLYVVGIDARRNLVTVGDKAQVLSRRLTASDLVLHAADFPPRGTAKIRYAHRAAPCSFMVNGDTLSIEFDEPQEAVTPGQSAVVYEGDRILCGGIIQGTS